MKAFPFLTCVLFLFSCNENSNTAPTSGKDTSHAVDTSAINSGPQADTGIYAVRLSSATLSLQQWDSTINLEHYLGKPLKQKTRKLDQNSDTFAGSFIKDAEYDGIRLKLFSPKGNGRTFWVQEIVLANNKYKTTRGTGIGDEFEKVKQVYPSLQKFPGENENMYYVADAGYEKSIELEFEKNRLKKLRMYYMLN